MQLDFNPVSRITIGTIGPAGQRVFLLQASQGKENITLKIEKEQAHLLATAVQELLKELDKKYGFSYSDEEEPSKADLMLREPMEPEFVVGQVGLGYDKLNDLIVLVVHELGTEDMPEESLQVIRFWATRPQMKAFKEYVSEIVSQGRPICPLCHLPIEPTGQFCPRTNGHASPGSEPCPLK